jgi:hypothetical protein
MFGSLYLALALSQPADADPPARPAELLQARACREAAESLASGDGEVLLSVETVPSCLEGIFKALGSESRRLAGRADATAVLRVGIGRAFNSTTLLFSSGADPAIHYVDDLQSITDILSHEWSEYQSPDGELGWSGFVLVADPDGTRVRFLTSAVSPLEAYENAIELEAEFFPGKQPPQTDER